VQSVQLALQHVSVSGTHAPPARWKPALQAIPQLVPSQVEAPFCGTGQGLQFEPHVSTLALETQLLLQRCEPAPQVEQTFPEQYWLVQSVGAPHGTPFAHVLPSDTQTPPQSTPVSFWFLIVSPHESATQALPFKWNPPLQETKTHVPELQLPTPLGYKVVQFTHPAPQQVLWAPTQTPAEGT
jgi:hypothetical protein